MKLIMKWVEAAWDVAAKAVLPDEVLRMDNLNMTPVTPDGRGLTPEDAERVRLQEAAEQRRGRRLRAMWSVTESFDDMAALFEPDQQDSEVTGTVTVTVSE